MPWSALGQLLTPLSYLRIRHPLKAWFDYVVPAITAVTVTVVLLSLPVSVPLLGESGVISVVTGLLQILVGFYIAALAAVATFAREGLDEPMSGDDALLMVERMGHKIHAKLSRRQFLCYLFGYLAFSALALYFLGSLANLLKGNFELLFSSYTLPYLRHLAFALYVFWTSNVLVTTLLGLHYLTDRLHRS